MRSILAMLILGVIIFTVSAAFGENQAAVATGVGQLIVIPADSNNVGVVSGPDQAPAGPDYNWRIDNKEN